MQVLQVVLAGNVRVPRAAAPVQALPLRPSDLASDRLRHSRAAACGVSPAFQQFSVLEAIAFAKNSAKANVPTGPIAPMAIFMLAILLTPLAVFAAHLANAGAIMVLTTQRECHLLPLIFLCPLLA